MKDSRYRETWDVSLLKDENENSLRIITPWLNDYIQDNNNFKRCFIRLKEGKLEFEKKLNDIRKIIFNEESLINWLYKIKKDAVGETDRVLIEFQASIGAKTEDINFELIGFYIGVYMQADNYLSILKAIEPLDKDLPHYTILDRLEEIDKNLLEDDNIPGYYKIQKDVKIKKHKYDVKNLDEYWEEYLSLKDKYEVSEDFGDTRTLLNDYHREFMWQLVNYRPRDDIKKYLSYHHKSYQGDKIDFLNHIEFRILVDIDGYAGNDYLIYKQLIKEWLNEKRNHLSIENKNFLTTSILSVLDSFLNDIVENIKRQDENKYNLVIKTGLNHRLISKKWYVNDQSMGGQTDSKSHANRAGVAFRDFIIINDQGQQISTGESFRLNFIPKEPQLKDVIGSHLYKIFRNDPLGVSPLFIIVYCETKNFSNSWEKYYEYVSRLSFKGNYYLEDISQIDNSINRANIKQLLTKYRRELSIIEVYHFFINMYP